MVAPRTGAPEVTIAEDQLEYLPITVAVYGDNAELGPRQLLTRWTFTDEERARIADGEDVYFALMTFGNPMQPVCATVGGEDWAPVEDSARND